MDDQALLASLDKRLSYIRDRVRGVALGLRPGCFIFGGGGTGKSYTVRATLEEVGRPWVPVNSRVTGRGLFNQLRDAPGEIHVIEDAEGLYLERAASGVLRSAAWGTSRDGLEGRLVTWGTANPERFVFGGGIVIVSNEDLPKTGDWRAFRTRVKPLEFNPPSAEIAAKMRELARNGHRHGKHRLEPEGCLEVAEEIIGRSHELQRPLDIRLLINSYQDRIQWETGAAENHWKELLRVAMEERTVVRQTTETRAQKASRELGIVRGLMHLPTAEQLPAWQRATNKSPASFYRAKALVKAADSQTLNFGRQGQGESRALGA